jgi:hypothetical protein
MVARSVGGAMLIFCALACGTGSANRTGGVAGSAGDATPQEAGGDDGVSPDTGAGASGDGGFADTAGEGPVGSDDGGDSGGDGAAVLDRTDAAGPLVPASIVVSPATTVATIGPGFAGLSYEKAHLPEGFFTGSNAPLIAMFDLLGPSVLRIGGNTVDQTTWTPAGAGHTPGQIAKPDVDALAAFVKAAGWTVIYGVNMKTSTPSAAADEVVYAASAFGASLYGFELGNEVDLYSSTAMEPTWSYANFKVEWEAFASAIRARVPGAPLTGPASANSNGLKNYGVPFARDEGAGINLLTQHYYRANGQAATSTIDLLLAPDPNLTAMLSTLAATVTADKIAGSRMAETNSFYNGGANGVSDSYGTALWAIDFLFTNALYGSSGVNFHGGDSTPGYTPIADANGAVIEARPDFYGILLFTLAGTGTLYNAKATVANVALSAYAVSAPDGSIAVVLVNKDRTKSVGATVDLGRSAAMAHVTRLAGPALEATAGVTLAGAPVTPLGTWAPGPLPFVPVSGSMLAVVVPAASAVLVRAQ